jgi:hypothetical protein
MLEDHPALAGTPPKRGIYYLLFRTKSTEPIFLSSRAPLAGTFTIRKDSLI